MIAKNQTTPLAELLRPQKLENFIGQKHLLAKDKPLYKAISSGNIHSMILWGPPGIGKTTLAHIIANSIDANFIKLSAVMAGVKDIKAAMADAKISAKPTILFIDEVHRFNKSQQDAFLPFVEDGTVIFIGATTENPSFELNNALLSRVQVYILKSLEIPDLIEILNIATKDSDTIIPDNIKQKIAQIADGDARRLLNIIEILLKQHHPEITLEILQQTILNTPQRFDKKGDNFYDQISALHKSVRGSSPDGALYWLARMLTGGVDPLYLGRRIIRMATEDIGNADPRAISITNDAFETYRKLGSPEGELALAQAVTYLAVAPKSNAVYTAFNQAMADAKKHGSLPVPNHICNAPTKLMRDIGKGKNYSYSHDEPDALSKGQTYFPDKMGERKYYNPVERGLEIKIKQKLDQIREVI